MTNEHQTSGRQPRRLGRGRPTAAAVSLIALAGLAVAGCGGGGGGPTIALLLPENQTPLK